MDSGVTATGHKAAVQRAGISPHFPDYASGALGRANAERNAGESCERTTSHAHTVSLPEPSSGTAPCTHRGTAPAWLLALSIALAIAVWRGFPGVEILDEGQVTRYVRLRRFILGAVLTITLAIIGRASTNCSGQVLTTRRLRARAGKKSQAGSSLVGTVSTGHKSPAILRDDHIAATVPSDLLPRGRSG